jgi:hypothetical protein
MRTGVNGDTGRDGADLRLQCDQAGSDPPAEEGDGRQGLSKTEMARRMCTRRASLGRLLDPDNDAVTLSTLQKAARAVGRALRLELV